MTAFFLPAALVCCALLYGLVPPAALAFVALVCAAACIYIPHTHSTGVSRIDYIAWSSRLRCVHPGLKLSTAFVLLVTALSRDSITVNTCIIVSMAALTVGFGTVTLRAYLSLLLLPAVFVTLSALALLFDVSKNAGGYFDLSAGSFYIVMTREAQRQARYLILKAFAALSVLYMLSLTTPMHDIASELRRVKVPALFVELMYLIYRYIFILSVLWSDMRNAAESRLGFSGGIFKGRAIRTYITLCSNILIASFRKASAAFDAMEARCYTGRIAFMSEAKPLTVRHTIAALCLCAVPLCCVILHAQGYVP